MEQFLQVETLVIELLLVASLVAIAVRRLRLPYIVALVVVGLAITFRQPLEINLTPELILALFVPPLVFEAAFHLSFENLRRNLASIVLLTVPGVIVTMLIVGGLAAWGIGLSLPLALVFGALISATDPVAVVAVFKTLGVPKRLSELVEGESLLNDGTAIVLFNLMVVVALTGQFNLVDGVSEFVRVAIGGTLVGLLCGWLIARLIAYVDDYLIEITLTTVLAFGAYLLAERLHFSGVLAVVAAGLINGNVSPHGMSPTTRIALFNFWEFIAFLVNSLVFLLIGLKVNLPELLSAWRSVLWAILIVLVARVVVVYGFSWLANRFTEPIALRWQHVLAWGGLRGALSLALALSLPEALGAERELLRAMVFGVVLFTLLVQATSIGHLLRWLRIVVTSQSQIEFEMRHARLTTLRVAAHHLEQQHREGLVSTHTWEALKAEMEQRTALLKAAVQEALNVEPALEADELNAARRELLRAQRSSLLTLRHNGVISDASFAQLVAEVDAELAG